MYDFLSGKIKYRITCHNPEAFINKLRFSVPVNDIVKLHDSDIEFTTGYRYRRAVEKMAREHNADAKKLWSYGLTVLVDKYKKRIGLWLGILISILIISVSSNMIWEVRVSGNENVPVDDIVRQLKLLGVAEGKFIDKDILETVYNNFLINEPRISWLSVNYDGTVAKVEVKETKVVPQRPDRERNTNIIAKCDGHIRRLDVFDGTAEVLPDEAVTKGQLLISSFVETRKTGEYMRAARGNVWASTVHKYKIFVHKNQSLLKKIDTVKNKDSFFILGHKIPVYLANSLNENNLEVDFYVNQISFLGASMPVWLEKQVYNKIKIEKNELSYSSAKAMAEKELSYRIEHDLQNAEIVGREERCVEEKEAYIFIFELMCIENISESVDFDFESE